MDKAQAMNQVQEIASGKGAMTFGATTATIPAWVRWITESPEAQALIIVLGMVVSISIIVVNVQTILSRRKSKR